LSSTIKTEKLACCSMRWCLHVYCRTGGLSFQLLQGRSIFQYALIAALGAPAPDAVAQRSPDPWRPQTVPLYGVSYSPGIGVLMGAGVAHTRYGFRALPPSTRVVAQLEYATGARSYRAIAAAEFRRPLAPAILNVELRASGLELVRFYGLGNATDGSRPDSVYEVRQRELLVGPRVTVPLAPRLRLALGPLLKYSHTAGDPGTVFATTGPHYGAGHFGELGAGAALDYDTRDHPLAPARGTRLRLAGQWYPALWDAVGAFGRLSAEAATHVSLGEPSTATLALRLGGLTTSGTTPFHEAAYVGGATTIRGYAEQRFSGRSGAYANAELRLLVGRPTVGDLGVFGLADAGRVWLAGEASDRWHAAAGGGLWFAWRHSRTSTVSIAAAKSPESTAVYVRAGFLF